MKYLKIVLFVIGFLLINVGGVFASEDFRTDYQVEYTLSQNQNTIDTQVAFNIKITNFATEKYVKQFSLSFPASFKITNLSASDDNGSITPQVTTDDDRLKILLEFSDPKTGRDSINNFNLRFNQENLFKINGNIWEVIIPTIENRGSSSYQIVVNLPPNTQKKISLAKPRPTLVTTNQIAWTNPTSKTIYAVFGDVQYYKLDLTYNIKNPNLRPVFTEVAFPPDTLYQKTYIDAIEPKPDSVSIDTDGNFMGKYYLGPSEQKKINYSGVVAVFNKPRDEFRAVVSNQFEAQKDYLLMQNDYWQLKNPEKFANLKDIRSIYDFVVASLQYDFKKISGSNERLGAQKVLQTPKQAACLEFTDLFTAIAREKGIPAREIEGYGFSQEETLRPISLLSDVLHSWPEYYDTQSKIWIPVDPTWQNTSGIDYFSSLDFNHITFAIHGKDPQYPLPAGMYKLDKTQDVYVIPVSILPAERKDIKVDQSTINKKITDQKNYEAKIIVRNDSNIFLTQLPVVIDAQNLLDINPSRFEITSLAPFEKKEIKFNYSIKKGNKAKTISLTLTVDDKILIKENISVYSYFQYLAFSIPLIFLVLGIIFLGAKVALNKKKN